MLAENNCFIMPLEFKAGLLLTTFLPFFGDGIKSKNENLVSSGSNTLSSSVSSWRTICLGKFCSGERVQRPIPEGPGSGEAEREDVSQQPIRDADEVAFCDFGVDVCQRLWICKLSYCACGKGLLWDNTI